MYGIVNQAIKGLVTENFGADKWQEIQSKSGAGDEAFISHLKNDDNTTFALATAASEVLNVPVSDVLKLFGEYWVLKTGREKYGDLLSTGGSSFIDFLDNLPAFHSRVMLVYPDIEPPEFEIDNEGDKQRRVHYYSIRSGLTDFMYGLLVGIGKMFASEVSVSVDKEKLNGADHDEFIVTW
jgi:hypothetical protein